MLQYKSNEKTREKMKLLKNRRERKRTIRRTN